MRFLHPNSAYLFLLFLPLLALYLRRSSAEPFVVPSLSFLNLADKNEKRERRNSGYYLPPVSFLIFLGGMSLLILALMSPVSTRVHVPDTDKLLAIHYEKNIPEPARRVFDRLDNVTLLNEDTSTADGIPILSIFNSDARPTFEGNILLLSQSSESNGEEQRRMSFDIISSGSDHEVARFSFSSSDTKSVQFPIKMAEAVDHFRKEGVYPVSLCVQKEGELSLWLAAAAGIVILCALLVAKR